MLARDLTLEIHLLTPIGPAQTDRFARELYAEVRELPLEISPRRRGPAPKGTKSIELVALGAWIVKLAPSVVPPLVGLIKDWVARHPQTPLKVSVERGNQRVVIEYNPEKTSLADVEAAIARLMK